MRVALTLSPRYQLGFAWRGMGPVFLFLVCLLVSVTNCFAVSADEVATGFIYNFAKSVTWPSRAFARADTPVTVGFIGKVSLADTFERNMRGKDVNGREFVVRRLDSAAGAEKCHIVFAAESISSQSVLEALKDKPVLTVGEGKAFLENGGMIAFIRDGARMVFELNIDAMVGTGLKPDPKLQKAARMIKHG